MSPTGGKIIIARHQDDQADCRTCFIMYTAMTLVLCFTAKSGVAHISIYNGYNN